MNNPMKIRRNHVWIATLLLLLPSAISFAAPPQGRLTGELWVTGTASVNGKTAVNGMTLLGGSRIETGPDGVVVANLGQLGRATVQTESDFTLDFRPNAISGNLNIGTVIINIPRGVAVDIKTPNGEVRVPVDQTPATLTVGITPEGTHAFIKRDQDRPRAFVPFEPTTGPPLGLVLPLFAAGTAGIIAAVTSFLTVAPALTPITPA